MEDAAKLEQGFEQEINKVQEEQRKSAEKFTSEINNQINGDLKDQLKNLFDHLPKDHLDKMKKQEDIIEQRGAGVVKQIKAQADKVSAQVDKIISNYSKNL